MQATLLVAAGLGGGALLGSAVVGSFGRAGGGTSSFAELSANPDALTATRGDTPQCADCADSYGVAARMDVPSDRRMSDAFRELGAVDADLGPVPEPTDDYVYGGRLPDPDLSQTPVAAVPVNSEQQKDPGEAPEPFPTAQ